MGATGNAINHSFVGNMLQRHGQPAMGWVILQLQHQPWSISHISMTKERSPEALGFIAEPHGLIDGVDEFLCYRFLGHIWHILCECIDGSCNG